MWRGRGVLASSVSLLWEMYETREQEGQIYVKITKIHMTGATNIPVPDRGSCLVESVYVSRYYPNLDIQHCDSLKCVFDVI